MYPTHLMRAIILTIIGFAPAGFAVSLPYAAGHKSTCLSYDELAWDQKHGESLQLLVDLGYFPPGVDYAVGELAYSLRTPKSIDPIKGSSRLLLSQVWYPVTLANAEHAESTTHTDFFTNTTAGQPLATAMSAIINVGAIMALEAGDYPNAPADYAAQLLSDPAIEPFVVDGPAGSVENAPIADGSFPLVVLDSPGHEQAYVAEELAARGYIVVAPVHPGDQFYGGILDLGGHPLDGTPIGGIPYGLNCSAAQIDAAKPVNGVLDFNSDITDTWLTDGGVYLGTLNYLSDIQEKLRLRAIDIGMLISRADQLFDSAGVVDTTRVGLLGFSLGGNTVQLIASDDSVLANSTVVPAEARAGLDKVTATVALAGNNRFASASSTATSLQVPSLAIQGRDDLVVNQGVDSTYGGGTLQEPNAVFADNYQHRYAPGVPAMRVLVDRFSHSDFQAGEPLISCLEHGGGTDALPTSCVTARPSDLRFDLVPAPGGGLEAGDSYLARPLQERTDITLLYTSAWFDLYVKEQLCTPQRDIEIDGMRIDTDINNLKRLTGNHFDNSSVQRRHRNLQSGREKGQPSGTLCE